MKQSKTGAVFALLAMLSACGGDSGGGSTATSSGGSTGSTTTTTSGCSLAERQNWAFATLNEWYLFPETLPTALDPAPYATVDSYIDALTATARSQRRDRFFTYLTSIATENAFISSGSSAGFGIRLSYDTTANRVFINEAFEGAPALAAGIDRGDEILAIGTSTNSLRNVGDILVAEGTAGITNALGPSTAGTARTLKLGGTGGARTLTFSKADYSLTPVSSRYGSRVIVDGTRRVGYLNLRTFISTADPALRTAFDSFRSQGITSFIIDFRYNGGGLVSTAELMGDLLGGNRTTSDVFDAITYRPSKANNNSTKRFAPQPQSVSPVKIAFIGTGATASASELVINGFVPFYGANAALIGTNTYGKPVGQVAIDRAACDDRLRVIAFSLRNGANSDAYYDGLATAVGATCKAADDLSKPLGDAQEASVRSALDYLGGVACTPIAGGPGTTSTGQRELKLPAMELITPDAPTPAQHDVPGLF